MRPTSAEVAPLGEGGEQESVEFLGRGQVSPKRFLDDKASPLNTARVRQMFDHRLKHRRRDGKIISRVLGPVECLAKRLNR